MWKVAVTVYFCCVPFCAVLLACCNRVRQYLCLPSAVPCCAVHLRFTLEAHTAQLALHSHLMILSTISKPTRYCNSACCAIVTLQSNIIARAKTASLLARVCWSNHLSAQMGTGQAGLSKQEPRIQGSVDLCPVPDNLSGGTGRCATAAVRCQTLRQAAALSSHYMANQVVRLWEAVLNNLSDIASSSDIAGNGHNTQLLDKLVSLPDPPKATWKRIVQDMQVRGRAQSQHMPAHRVTLWARALACGVHWPTACMTH